MTNAGGPVAQGRQSVLLVAIENLVAGLEKSPALLPPYTTGSVRIRSNLDIKLGRVIGGWQWRAADRRCASRCGHSSRGASGLGVAFVGVLCWRIDSRGVESPYSKPGALDCLDDVGIPRRAVASGLRFSLETRARLQGDRGAGCALSSWLFGHGSAESPWL